MHNNMKIGIFDSGLGGLIIAEACKKHMPEYDFVYLGDTKRVPYGNRSEEVIYQYLRQGVEWLFRHGCAVVVVACNTASAHALRRIQQELLPQKYPRRRVLGVIVPTVEAIVAGSTVGLLATASTVLSGAYEREFTKRNDKIRVVAQAAPLLVPLIETNSLQFATQVVQAYIRPLLRKKVGVIVLGCTHYALLKRVVRKQVGKGIQVVSQDELIPDKLREYLKRHPELDKKITKNGTLELFVTDISRAFVDLARQICGRTMHLQKAVIDYP